MAKTTKHSVAFQCPPTKQQASVSKKSLLHLQHPLFVYTINFLAN